MKWIVSTLFTLTWALWLGGAVATLLFVITLFSHDRPLALAVAPQLFLTFEKYQLTLAAVTFLCLVSSPRLRSPALITLILIAVIIATTSALIVTPQIENLRINNQTDTPAFRTLHGVSMTIYLLEVLALLTIGILISRPIAKPQGQ